MKSSKGITTLFSVLGTLVVIVLTLTCMQVFAKSDKYKPTTWYHKLHDKIVKVDDTINDKLEPDVEPEPAPEEPETQTVASVARMSSRDTSAVPFSLGTDYTAKYSLTLSNSLTDEVLDSGYRVFFYSYAEQNLPGVQTGTYFLFPRDVFAGSLNGFHFYKKSSGIVVLDLNCQAIDTPSSLLTNWEYYYVVHFPLGTGGTVGINEKPYPTTMAFDVCYNLTEEVAEDPTDYSVIQVYHDEEYLVSVPFVHSMTQVDDPGHDYEFTLQIDVSSLAATYGNFRLEETDDSLGWGFLEDTPVCRVSADGIISVVIGSNFTDLFEKSHPITIYCNAFTDIIFNSKTARNYVFEAQVDCGDSELTGTYPYDIYYYPSSGQSLYRFQAEFNLTRFSGFTILDVGFSNICFNDEVAVSYEDNYLIITAHVDTIDECLAWYDNDPQNFVITMERTDITYPEDPTKEGYTFAGWYLDEALSVPYTGGVITSDMTLYPKFEALTFTVTFESGLGSELESMTVEYGSHPVLPTPKRTGYTFLGWTLEDGTVYDSEATAITGDLLLYAKWEVKKCTVTFLNEDGTVYCSFIVDYGTVLIDAVNKNDLKNRKFIETTTNETLNRRTVIESDLTLVAVKMTDAEKIGAFISDHIWVFWTMIALIGALGFGFAVAVTVAVKRS